MICGIIALYSGVSLHCLPVLKAWLSKKSQRLTFTQARIRGEEVGVRARARGLAPWPQVLSSQIDFVVP